VPSLFYHNREIGRGVPDMGSVRFSAELWAMSGRAPGRIAPEKSTNCEVERPARMHSVGARPASLVDGLVSLATGVLVALLGPQILLPHFLRYGPLPDLCGNEVWRQRMRSQRHQDRLPGGSC